MRILLVNKFWFLRGGAERVAFTTREMLLKGGHQVEVFGAKHPDNAVSNKYFIPAADYRRLGKLGLLRHSFKTLYNREAAENFSRLCAEWKPDVVHFHNIYHELSFSLLDAAKKMKLKTVMTLHDYKMIAPNYNLFHHGRAQEECQGGKYYNCILKNCLEDIGKSFFATWEMYYWQWKKYREMVGRYISPSFFLREKFVNEGFKQEKISVVRNPVDTASFSPPPDAKEKDYVLFAGRLSEIKGLRALLAAAKLTPSIPYAIAGKGPLQNYLEETIKKEQLKNVDYLGFRNEREMHRSLAEARLAVAPSIWYENSPLSVLEAKAMKKVVVASDIGGMSELLPPDMLVAAGDAKALADKISFWYRAPAEVRLTAGEKLYNEILRKHSPGQYYKEIMEVYQRL